MADLTQMLGNLARIVPSTELMMSGFAYLMGLFFIVTSILKFKGLIEKKGGSSEGFFVPTAYFLGGAALIYLPSITKTAAGTLFGSSSILQYTEYEPLSIYSIMMKLIHLIGLIWFIRGCVLVTHASEPGVKHGPKGLMFILGGIFAMNMEATQSFLGWAMGKLMSMTLGGASV